MPIVLDPQPKSNLIISIIFSLDLRLELIFYYSLINKKSNANASNEIK